MTLLLISQAAANDWTPLWQLLYGDHDHGNSWDAGKLTSNRLRSMVVSEDKNSDEDEVSKRFRAAKSVGKFKPGALKTHVVRDNFSL